MSRRYFGWLIAAFIPALTLTAVTVPPPNLGRALEAQRELVARAPNDVRALNDLGNLLALAGDLEGAEAAYRRALELEPGKASARYNLALLLEQSGRRKEAFKQLRILVSENPGYAWGWYQIGSLYDLAGQKGKAIDSYARAFRLDPQLAFPEVNPHVIDNSLFTEALIAANQRPSAGTLAPKAYDEPARITGILVPPPPLDGSEDEGPAAETTVEMEPAEGEPAPPGDRVLSEGDLDREGGVNQVQGGSSAGRYSRSRSGSSVTRHAPTTRQGAGVPRFRSPQRDTTTQGGAQVQGSPQGGQQGEAAAETPNGTRPLTTPQGRVRYRPGTASTGSLGIELVPSSEEVAPAR